MSARPAWLPGRRCVARRENVRVLAYEASMDLTEAPIYELRPAEFAVLVLSLGALGPILLPNERGPGRQKALLRPPTPIARCCSHTPQVTRRRNGSHAKQALSRRASSSTPEFDASAGGRDAASTMGRWL
jgi:hypothetical protein